MIIVFINNKSNSSLRNTCTDNTISRNHINCRCHIFGSAWNACCIKLLLTIAKCTSSLILIITSHAILELFPFSMLHVPINFVLDYIVNILKNLKESSLLWCIIFNIQKSNRPNLIFVWNDIYCSRVISLKTFLISSRHDIA